MSIFSIQVLGTYPNMVDLQFELHVIKPNLSYPALELNHDQIRKSALRRV